VVEIKIAAGAAMGFLDRVATASVVPGDHQPAQFQTDD
jgi:hypothetical protein